QLAGVLVVFTLLVAPALLASMQKRFSQIGFAFVYGWTFSILAIAVSYFYDLPTGYSIVFVGALGTLFGVLFMSKKDK
ncbi:metal ABC transporter permease, partial [Sulfurimonas sp. MAG313]